MLALAAEAHPLRSAVEHGTRSWSYGKFDEVVRRIAGALYAAGARRCDVIAVTGERSCALVASMAAVLRAGGVLLCLDQNLPAGRRELMLREAKVCAILVIERPTCPRSPMGPFLPSITKGCRLSQPIRYPPQTFQLATLRPTSSSPLERPVCRRGAGRACRPVALHRMAAKGVRHCSGDRAAQLTGLSFDVVLRDVFMPLASGATLVIPDSSDVLPDRMIEWLSAARITLMHTVPSSPLAGSPMASLLRSKPCVTPSSQASR